MGSGTTALAAKMTQRHYLGYEISSEYVAAANARLAALGPPRLVEERVAPRAPKKRDK